MFDKIQLNLYQNQCAVTRIYCSKEIAFDEKEKKFRKLEDSTKFKMLCFILDNNFLSEKKKLKKIILKLT